MEAPLVNKKYQLQKFPGKGGWTYAEIPEILQDKQAPFGWVRVRGFIDNIEIKNYHLMPMGNGHLFLPVKAGIRKMIGKKEGDYVQVILYPDNKPIEIPVDIQLCFANEPAAFNTFQGYTIGEQKAFVEWVCSARKEETKVERIAKMMTMLEKKQKMSGK